MFFFALHHQSSPQCRYCAAGAGSSARVRTVQQLLGHHPRVGTVQQGGSSLPCRCCAARLGHHPRVGTVQLGLGQGHLQYRPGCTTLCG